MTPRLRLVAFALAHALTAGEWREGPMLERARAALGSPWPPLGPLVRRVLRCFPAAPPRRRLRALRRVLELDRGLRRACLRDRPRVARLVALEPAMEPAPGPPSSWALPGLTGPDDLACFLGVTPDRLAWLADLTYERRAGAPGPACHYHYRFSPKRSGGLRLIEAPKGELARAQRKVLGELLGKIPLHPSAAAFRKGASPLSHASLHAGREVVVRVDLADFFGSISAARVEAIFATAGYPPPVARLLSGLCTHRTPAGVFRLAPRPATMAAIDALFRQRQRATGRHLPQGAPTSPALANLCAFRLDLRLAALAEASGARYSRYADDLTFSGDGAFARQAGAFAALVARIARAEGFSVNAAKTRVMRRGSRQRVAGLVVNERPAIARDELDRLKATLTNCVRHGPASQNCDGHRDYRAHLLGKIAHVAHVDPGRGERLRALFERIEWPEG